MWIWSQQRVIGAVALLLWIIAAPAVAQEENRQFFNGPYVGGEGGFNDFQISQDLGDVSNTKAYYGGFLGWRYETSGGYVLGVEGRVGNTNVGDVQEDVATSANEPLITEAKLGRSFGFEAVLGTALGDAKRFLLFASGGYLNQKVSGRRLIEGAEEMPIPTQPFSENEDGFRIGGGIEIALWRNFSLRTTGHFSNAGPADQIQVLAGAIAHF